MSTLEKRCPQKSDRMINQRRRWFIQFSLIWLFAVSSLFALDPDRRISQYAHTAWRMQDGSFTGSPTVITQTKDGYLWIGTQTELVRFDGVRFVPGTTSRGVSLPQDKITSLLTARDGSLWIGTITGLSNLKDGTLHRYSNTVSGISKIIEDHEGTIWVTRYAATDGKGSLCRVTGRELQCYGKADGIPVGYAVALSEDGIGNLWIGSYVLCRWRAGSSTIYFQNKSKDRNVDPGVMDIAAGPDGSVWVALERVGPNLGIRHYIDGKWGGYVAAGFDSASIKAQHLFLDRSGSLWIGTQNQGLYRIHDGTVDHYRSSDGLSGDSVSGFYQDQEGNLWVATNGGIDRFRDTAVVSISLHEGLPSADIRSVLASRDGTVWVGGEGALSILRDGKMSAITRRNGLPGDDITALFEDHIGRLWLGIDDKLIVYDRGRFIEIKNKDGTALAAGAWINAVTEDVDQNILALATGFGQPHLFQIANQRVREEIPLSNIPYPRWIAADKDAGIWIGSRTGQLAHYRNGHMGIISLAREERRSIVESLLVDSDNSIWVATSNGLSRWKDGRLNLLDTRNGLPCSEIFSVHKDNHGFFWLYAQCGLLRIAETELQSWWEQPNRRVAIDVLDSSDGASPGRGASQPRVSEAPNGLLWFTNGTLVQMVDPEKLYKNDIPPPVRIEEIIADHKRYGPQEHLHLPALTRELQIDYTALSFSAPRKVRFRYRLEGKDDHWEDPGTRRQAFYEDIGPGKYRFHVIACNNDGLWNDVGAALDFSIAPSWYQTWWFRILSVIAIFLAFGTLYRLRMRQISKALSASFDERLSERTRLARELHDTLLQTIQGSKMVADDALDQPSDPDHMRRAMERLSQWLGQSMGELRTALNSLRTSTTQGNDLAESLRRASEDCLVKGKMRVTLSVTGPAQEVHPIVRDEVYRIAYEAIRNADIHSGASQLEIELTYSRDLVMRIRDNGIGIDHLVAELGREGHFGLQGMRERAVRIGATLTLVSSASSGTEITLMVPGGILFRKSKDRSTKQFSSSDTET
jgi:signal transduction histidine kinase/ligand-binding sensor domain-containing protein